MKIAVLSGKGGTGKTFCSVNLAAVAKDSSYIDCDVEEPNGHLFFKPVNISKTDVTVDVPVVDKNKCNGSRDCVEFCKFNALAYINGEVIVFEDICHSCGGCKLVCPEGAISEKKKRIGKIEKGVSGGTKVVTGILDIGEITGVPVINQLLEGELKLEGTQVIDCPPGSSCSVMESIEDADYCVLVAEPTIFGTHNLNMVYELAKLFDKPLGVVINKYIDASNIVEEFCKRNNIEILERIPFDERIGELNSNGHIIVREDEEYRKIFSDLLSRIEGEVGCGHERIINS